MNDFKLEYTSFKNYLYNARLSYLYAKYNAWPNKNNNTFIYYRGLLKLLDMAINCTKYVKELTMGKTYRAVSICTNIPLRTLYHRTDDELAKIKKLILLYEAKYFYLLNNCKNLEVEDGN